MASHYSFKGTMSGAELSITAAQTFLERSQRSHREGGQRGGGWGCSIHAGAKASPQWLSVTALK